MGIGEIKTLAAGYWQNPRVKQIVMLFSVNMAGIPLGIVTSIILTRYLGPTDFGNYQFLDNLFSLTALISTFGFFQAANRALVLNHDKDKAREYYGSTLIILIGIFLLASIGLIIYSLFDVNLNQKHLSKILLFSIPLGWVYLATSYFEVLFQADNRMNLLAIARLLTKVFFLISAIIIYFFFFNRAANKLATAWTLYLLSLVSVSLYVFFKLRLSFKNLRTNLKEIWQYNKTYGFHVYFGAAFAVGVGQLTSVIISYYGVNNSGVGFYALAQSLASPLQFIPNTIATTNYKEFAGHNKISSKLTKVTILLTGLSLVALWIVVPYFVKYFYGNKFKSVIYLNFIVSIGVALYGLADFYNRFLGANGHGKLLRNTAFIVGILILISNFILIPYFGAMGAAFTRLLGGISYLSCTFYYYKKTTKKSLDLNKY